MPNDFYVAIAVGNPNTPSQTFVRRHITHLFGGRTAIICTKRAHPFDERPTLALRPTIRWYQEPARWIGHFQEPGLETRFLEFLSAHNVKFILAEFGADGLKVFKLARRASLPMYCYFRGFDASEKLGEPHYVAQLREMCEQIDGIVAVSQSLLDNLRSAGIHCRKQLVIPSGVDTEKFAPGEKQPNLFLSIGRFVGKKAPALTIEAFAKAAASNPDIALEMVGDGPLLDSCRSLTKRLGIVNRVNFRGALGSNEVGALLARTRYFLQHSVVTKHGDTEGMPSSVQEAMSSACVVIATRHAGIPEHITHDVNGVLVEERDVEGYAHEIERLCRDTGLADRLAANARTYAIANLDYRKLYQRLENEIQSEVRALSRAS